jgi:hypothetical protein
MRVAKSHGLPVLKEKDAEKALDALVELPG